MVDGSAATVVNVPSPLSVHTLPPAGEPPASSKNDQWKSKPMSSLEFGAGTLSAGPQLCVISSRNRYRAKSCAGALWIAARAASCVTSLWNKMH